MLKEWIINVLKACLGSTRINLYMKFVGTEEILIFEIETKFTENQRIWIWIQWIINERLCNNKLRSRTNPLIIHFSLISEDSFLVEWIESWIFAW